MNTQQRAADTMTNAPVYIRVQTGWFLRLFFIKKVRFAIKPLYYGSMLKISGIYATLARIDAEKIDTNPMPEAMRSVHLNAPKMAHMVAIAVLNNEVAIRLLGKILGRWLMWHTTAADLDKLVALVLECSDMRTFLNTIVSLGALDVSRPKVTSPNGTGESIAPGEL